VTDPDDARDESGIGDHREGVDVRTRRERRRRAPGDDEAPQRCVLLDLVEREIEIAQERQIEHRERSVRRIEHEHREAELGPLDAHARTRRRRVRGGRQAARVDHASILSSTTAAPWPPPMHAVARP
jgi:hypothetical protein